MQSLKGVALGVVVVGAVGAVTFHRLREEGRAQVARGQVELEELRGELEALRAESSQRALLAARLSGASRRIERDIDRPSEVDSEEESWEEDLEEGAEDSALTEADVVAGVDSTFDAEAADASWSSSATIEAEAALEAGLPSGSRLGKVECRSSLCRAETFHANVDEFQSFVSESFLGRERASWNGGFYAAIIDQSEDVVSAVSYIAKEGHSVPLPEVP